MFVYFGDGGWRWGCDRKGGEMAVTLSKERVTFA